MARDRYREDVAPYVLGALAPLEAEALEKHLRRCGECRRELAELRSGAEALARSVEQVEPPPSLRARVIADVDAEIAARADVGSPAEDSPAAEPTPGPASPQTQTRRPTASARLRERLRRSGSGGSRRLIPRPVPLVATGLVVLLAGVAGWALGGGRADRDRTVTASVDRERLPGVRARMVVPAEGEDPVLHLAGLRNLGRERTYEIWVQRDGEIGPGPLFSPTADGAAVTGIPGRAEEIEAVFVTRERAGGARAPTERPVVSVPLRS